MPPMDDDSTNTLKGVSPFLGDVTLGNTTRTLSCQITPRSEMLGLPILPYYSTYCPSGKCPPAGAIVNDAMPSRAQHL